MASRSAPKRVKRTLVATLALLVLALPAGAQSAAAGPVASDFYGVNAPLLFSWPEGRWDAHLRTVGSSGAGFVRADASWWTAEPNAPVGGAHDYRWSHFDDQVTAMSRRGLRWYPVMAYSTPWSGQNGSDKSPPKHVGDYTAYVRAFAARYGRGGSFWRSHPGERLLPVTTFEIWNEQNSPIFWAGQAGAPERYADLYLAARSAIRSVDPAALVVVGGLSNVREWTPDTQFLRRMYAHRSDLRGNVDAIGFHPYSVGVRGVYSDIRRMRQALRGMGQGGVPLEITEVGWTTTRTSDGARAAGLSELARELPGSDCNVTRLIPYSWVTRESNPGDDEDWFGMANLNGTPKPSGSAFIGAVRAMTGRLGSSPKARQASICGGGRIKVGQAKGGLKVKLRVRGSLRRGLRIRVRCARPCRLRVALVSRRGAHQKRLAGRRRRQLKRRQRVRIHGGPGLLRAARGKVRLRVLVVGTGSRKLIVRRVRRF